MMTGEPGTAITPTNVITHGAELASVYWTVAGRAEHPAALIGGPRAVRVVVSVVSGVKNSFGIGLATATFVHLSSTPDRRLGYPQALVFHGSSVPTRRTLYSGSIVHPSLAMVWPSGDNSELSAVTRRRIAVVLGLRLLFPPRRRRSSFVTVPMPGVTVSSMSRQEVDETASLVRSIISPLTYYSESARTAEAAKYTPEELRVLVAEDKYSVLVARAGRELVGFCISRYDDGIIWLAWFGVREDFRGSGTASMLLDALEKATRARGCGKIWCDTRTENVPSQRVLQRAGYSRICTVFRHWYGHDFHLWEKPLEVSG